MSIYLLVRDPSIGIEYLTTQGILPSEPGAIAQFLASDGLNRQAIGEYFGRLSDPLATKVFEEFLKRLGLCGLHLDVALRRLLEKVHPVGESQKMQFFLQVFKKCYIERNEEKVAREFRDPETVEVLAYSIMLLHTSLYNRNARKHGKSMTREEFIRNNRGIDNGEDLSVQLLGGIYDRLAQREFRCLPDPLNRVIQVGWLLAPKHKPTDLVQHHRRFIAWFSGLEVVGSSGKESAASQPHARTRTLFIFNDLLIITKSLAANHAHLTPQCYTDVPLNGNFSVRQTVQLSGIKMLDFESEGEQLT